MATSMKIYAEIASRYGVDPKDETAVDKFYEVTILTLLEDEQEKILTELMNRDGE